jgi:hypothetical protein
MYLMKRETIKSYILITLIITCFIQVGILWNYQNHGFPISFLRSFINRYYLENTELDEKFAREEFFTPYRIVISSGWESHWVVEREDKNFNILWEDAKLHLQEVLNSKSYQIFIPNERWGEFITKRGYSIEFKTNIKRSLLRYFLGFSGTGSDDSPGLYKMMVVPGDFGGVKHTTIYIMDNTGIYMYDTRLQKDGLGYDEFQKMISKLEQSRYDKVLEYKVFAELVNTERFNYSVSPDVLFQYSSAYKGYNNISCYVPEKIGRVNFEKPNNLDELAKIVLGKEKDSYDHSIDSNGTVLFQNLDSIYRIYSDGFLEYRYIPGVDGIDKGNIGSAFASALSFVKRISELNNTKSSLYLSGISERQGYFIFTFDYLVEDVPVTFGEDFKARGNYSERNAVVIEVKGKRVVGCRWILRSFEKSREEYMYNMNTIDLLSKSKLKLSDVSIRDMYVSYVINKAEGKSLQPYWIIEDGHIKSKLLKVRNIPKSYQLAERSLTSHPQYELGKKEIRGYSSVYNAFKHV